MRHIFPALLLLPLLLAACSQPSQQEITEIREPGATKRKAPPKVDAGQRLGMGQQNATEDPLGGITFHHDVPEGWEKVPLTSMRQVNLRMTDTPEAECYFTFLPGGGGGLNANINRWRNQMGQEPLSNEAIAALPKKTIFRQPATFILIDGDFIGMGSEPKADYRMYGLVLTYNDPNTGRDQAFFLKMVGPRAVLEAQEAAFDTVASSLHAVGPNDNHSHGEEHGPNDGHDHGLNDGHDHGAEHSEGDGHNHDADSDEGHGAHGGAMKQTSAPSGGSTGFAWTVPEGWSEVAPSMMRQANLIITGRDDVECYFTVLGGTGGGLDMNINRWQAQMGQPELSADAIAALPKKPLLDGDSTFVTIDGTFGGMSGQVQRENYRMYGLVRVEESQALFLKMTGPRDVLETEEARFLAFGQSIKNADAAPAPEAAPMPAANPHGVEDPTPPGGFNPEGLTWTAPAGWKNGGERMMRVVTFEFGDTECYITSLAGEAGGVEGNINRWVGQMGQPELGTAALAALPRITALGKEVAMVDVAGNFTGMSGLERPGYTLLGTVVPMGGQTVFVKMIGPSAEVEAEKANFVAFCASIKP
jgi:hypothetical protein